MPVGRFVLVRLVTGRITSGGWRVCLVVSVLALADIVLVVTSWHL